MDIKNLPGVGRQFSSKISRSGHKSLRAKLSQLTRANSQFRNLDKGNVATISDKFAQSTVQRAIRLKGGLSAYQTRKLNRQFTNEYKANRETFTREDLRDAKEVVKHFSLAGQAQDDTPPKPRPNIIRRPSPSPIEPNIQTPPRSTSISDLLRNKNLPNSKPIPPSSGLAPRPPRIPLIR